MPAPGASQAKDTEGSHAIGSGVVAQAHLFQFDASHSCCGTHPEPPSLRSSRCHVGAKLEHQLVPASVLLDHFSALFIDRGGESRALVVGDRFRHCSHAYQGMTVQEHEHGRFCESDRQGDTLHSNVLEAAVSDYSLERRGVPKAMASIDEGAQPPGGSARTTARKSGGGTALPII
jgi:hypothetical protein